MTEEEYLEVLTAFYGEEITQEIKESNFLITLKNPDGTIALIVVNRTEAELAFELKIETAAGSQSADLRDWEKARTSANANTKSNTKDGAASADSDSASTTAPLYLKCPPRAIQTWILK